MKTITLKQLIDNQACSEQVRRFESLFGASVEVTLELALKHAADFDFYWAARFLLPKPLWAEYERAKAPLLAEYERAKALLWAEYERAEALLWAEYERAEALLWAEHKRARAKLFATLYLQSENSHEIVLDK